MAEYIEREAVRDVLVRYLNTPHVQQGYHYSQGMRLGIGTCIELIGNIRAADVVERKRGEWVRLDAHRGMEQFKCSLCRSECYVPTCMNEPMYEYCPNCGADMK